MTRDGAVALLFWHHQRNKWNAANLHDGWYVWPPFPREDYLRTARIQIYKNSQDRLTIPEPMGTTPEHGNSTRRITC